MRPGGSHRIVTHLHITYALSHRRRQTSMHTHSSQRGIPASGALKHSRSHAVLIPRLCTQTHHRQTHTRTHTCWNKARSNRTETFCNRIKGNFQNKKMADNSLENTVTNSTTKPTMDEEQKQVGWLEKQFQWSSATVDTSLC